MSDLRVGAIASGPDGALWFGSEQVAKVIVGLSTRTEQSGGFVYTLQMAPGGGMWAGTNSGAFRLNSQPRISWNSSAGLGGVVNAIAAAANGVVWFGTTKGLFRSEDAESRPVPVVKRGLLSGGVRSLLIDGDGLLWIGTDNGAVRFDGTAWAARTRIASITNCSTMMRGNSNP